MTTTSLQTKQLCVSFGQHAVLNNISLSLVQGEKHALIGPNGAGKTTLINTLAGTLKPSSGSIFIANSNITALNVSQRVRKGLARTFQVNSLFPKLTPKQSLSLAIIEREKLGSRWWKILSADRAINNEADYWLEFIGLAGVSNKQVRYLPYGEQRLLELALALATKPGVLLLDEPVAGLPEHSVQAVIGVLNALPDNVTVLLVEHDMNLVFNFAQKVSVLAQGMVIAAGSPDFIRSDRAVQEAYLGAQASSIN